MDIKSFFDMRDAHDTISRAVIWIGLAAMILAVSLGACASLGSESAAKKAAAFLMLYCSEPVETRAALRAAVNAQIAPNRVQITCEGDPQE